MIMRRPHSTKQQLSLPSLGVGCLIGFLVGRQSSPAASFDRASPILGLQTPTTASAAIQRQTKLIGKSVWDVLPFEHTPRVSFQNGKTTDAYNPFYNYLFELDKDKSPAVEFPNLPLFHSWFHFFEAYHNHMHRFRKQQKVVFMEIGVQSGGKIALLRDYFGPNLEYIGVDINPSTKMFEGPNVHIEIGDSSDRSFLQTLQKKYPHIDIFLDDGGHTMQQQRIALEVMLPHVQPEGVYILEDLSTSWGTSFDGIPMKDMRDENFRETTAVGLVHRTLDWLNAGWITGTVMQHKLPPDDYYKEAWWRTIPEQVKHVHVYNQLVVYEKGVTYPAGNLMTVGHSIPIEPSGTHEPVNWKDIMNKLQLFTGSAWKW